MNTLTILAIALVSIVGIVLFLRSRIASEWDIQASDIPAVISKLKSSPESLAWAQVIVKAESSQAAGLALDYSVNKGVFEFNWCLLSPKNIEDKHVLIEFLDNNGFSHAEIVADNGCPLIRVIGPGIETIANRILAEIYHTSGPLTLLGEGFQWP